MEQLSNVPFDHELFTLLRCPEAQVPLKFIAAEGDQADRLVSTDTATRRSYPIVDGIPVMLIEESTVLSENEWSTLMAGSGPVGA